MPELGAQVEVRIMRGLELWREHRGRLEVDVDGCWLVPSDSEPGLLHRASIEEDTCSCDDHRFTLLRCKHLWCAMFEMAFGLSRPEIRYAENPYSADVHGASGRRLR